MNESPRSGRLIVVEGIDGAGKSTIIRRLSEECREGRIAYVVSREPTSGKWGAMLRETARTGRLSLEMELELFLQDRAEHVLTLIAPALEAGKIVILDRYYFSTAAYQGARGADPAAILAANEEFAPAPDLVLLLDIDPIAGRARIAGRGDVPDDFEHADALAKVRAIFLSIERPFIARIDASQPPETVERECLARFHQLLESPPEARLDSVARDRNLLS